MDETLRATIQSLQLTIECEGKITLRLPARARDMRTFLSEDPPSPTGVDDSRATRTTRIHCPTHGPQTFTETYDVESGQWTRRPS